MQGISQRWLRDVVDRALDEDQAQGDATSNAVIPQQAAGQAAMMAKAEGILAGVEVAACVFQQVGPGVKADVLLQDGNDLRAGDRILQVAGGVRDILRAERVALNFVQRLSGIATMTGRFVKAVDGLGVRIVDTRKTAPGLRSLEKYAVRVGGGGNHRLNLGDGVLVKDNHISWLRSQGLSLGQVVRLARQNAPFTLRIEVEVSSVQEAEEAVSAGADVIMLDNMGLDEMRLAVLRLKGKALLEASGGIDLETVRQVAEVGVDMISLGAITHSAPALDISLEL